MSTEGNDPRGRGRGFFRSRRRPAAPEERPPAGAVETPATPPAPGTAAAATPEPTPPEPTPTPEPPPTPPPVTAPEDPRTASSPPAEPPAPLAAAPEPPEVPAESAGAIPMTGATVSVDATPVAPPAATPEADPTNQWMEQPADAEIPRETGPEPEDEPVDEVTLAPTEGGHVEPPAASTGPTPTSNTSALAEASAAVEDAAPGGGGDGSEGYELPKIFAIANQKGGVGKTTTSVNLGASLAELGYRVLVVDLDPQGNATTGLGINARNLQASVYDVIMSDSAVEDCVEPTSLKNLFVVPATIDLAGAEIELVPAFSRELKLRRALEEVRDEYDYVLIDCPPSLGLLTVNGLAAADDVIVPIQCEYYALEGLSQLIRNVTLVRTNLNPKLDVRGIVLTMYDARTKLADQVEQEVRDHFGSRVYQTVVPRTVRLSEAPSFGQPIIVFDSTSRGAVAYRELAKEVSSGANAAVWVRAWVP